MFNWVHCCVCLCMYINKSFVIQKPSDEIRKTTIFEYNCHSVNTSSGHYHYPSVRFKDLTLVNDRQMVVHIVVL